MYTLRSGNGENAYPDERKWWKCIYPDVGKWWKCISWWAEMVKMHTLMNGNADNTLRSENAYTDVRKYTYPDVGKLWTCIPWGPEMLKMHTLSSGNVKNSSKPGFQCNCHHYWSCAPLVHSGRTGVRAWGVRSGSVLDVSLRLLLAASERFASFTPTTHCILPIFNQIFVYKLPQQPQVHCQTIDNMNPPTFQKRELEPLILNIRILATWKWATTRRFA